MKETCFKEVYESCEHFGFNKETTAEQCWNMGYQLGRSRWHWGPHWMVNAHGWLNTQLSKLRNLFALLAVLVSATLFAAGAANAPNVLFSWSYSGPTSNTVFRVYGTTNLSQPSTNWPLVVAWSTWGTNSTGQLTNSIFVTPAAYFFAMTASNGFWGESPNSVTVSTPAPASVPQSVGLNYIGP